MNCSLARNLPSELKDLQVVWCGDSWRDIPPPAPKPLVPRAPRLVPLDSPLDVRVTTPRAGLPAYRKPIQEAILKVLWGPMSVVALAAATGYSRKQIHGGLAALRAAGLVRSEDGPRVHGQRYHRTAPDRMSA